VGRTARGDRATVNLPLISIVVPVFDNVQTLAKTCSAVATVLDGHATEAAYELVCVNDGSRDDSWKELCRLQAEAPSGRFRLVNFTRNFGQLAALLAGYRHARGDCIVSISADLQDPAELIWQMVEAWRQGHKLVVAARARRNDGFIYDTIAGLCWRIFRRIAVPRIPKGGFDFFLMDRMLRDFYVQDPEQNLFLQGRLLFYGTEPYVIAYERRARPDGRSRTSLARNLKYFIDGIAGYSYLPVRLMSLAGLVLFILSLLAGIIIAWYVLRYGSRVEGWASLMIVVLGLQGLQMLFIGIIGEYLWRTLEETRRRPHYIVDRVVE